MHCEVGRVARLVSLAENKWEAFTSLPVAFLGVAVFLHNYPTSKRSATSG